MPLRPKAAAPGPSQSERAGSRSHPGTRSPGPVAVPEGPDAEIVVWEGRAGARKRKEPGRRPAGSIELPEDVRSDLETVAGSGRGPKLAARLEQAAEAYARDRYAEAARLTSGLVGEVPDVAAVQELHGLVCYRMGRWRQAVRHLDAARRLTGDVDQLPVLMDCHRAQGHHQRVRALWEELRRSGAAPELIVEGRLVLAADLADQGELASAIDELERAGGSRMVRRPAQRHLRQWYLLADLYERAGDTGRARRLFGRIVDSDPDVADAAERLEALGGAVEDAAPLSGRVAVTLGELARRRPPAAGG